MRSHIDGETCRHLSRSEMFWRPTLTVRNGRYVCYRTVRSGQEALRVAADRGATNDQESKVYADLDTVYRFTLPLCSREAHVREAALLHIEKIFNQWLNGLCSPEVVTQSHSNDSEQDTIPPPCYSLISLHVPSIASLANLCPFEDVRDKCKHILLMIKEKGVSVPELRIEPPSDFIPHDELPDPTDSTNKTHGLLVEAFLQNNRPDHVSQVMGLHPAYLEMFLRTHHYILRGDGPLPFDYRHFIAIMAAGRHQCSYLINQQKQEFVLQGGDQSWLKGLNQIPKKLRDLYEINKILAHRPWLINKSHIEKLTKGADSWSLAEVVHAIVLLTHFHSLCSFVFGCGISEEADRQMNAEKTKASPVEASNNKVLSSSPRSKQVRDGWSEAEVGVETLMERMKTLSERAQEFSAEERAKRFERVESQSVELAMALPSDTPAVQPGIQHFVDDPAFVYQDFAKRGEVSEIPTFRVQDYSWDDHGYSLVNRLYNEVGNLLDDKFKVAYNLTYYTMGGRTDVDTSRFRRAIWNYIQCMYGIRHDDYDYGEVNQLLERSLKAFIKSACCFPERVTKADYDRVLREFKHSEKVHVMMMVLEARMQAELLYALRAVMRYMT